MNVWGQWSFKPNYYQYDASVLNTNTVYRLLEDPYGFIWMVSDKGILIFNGKTFETIKIPGKKQEIVNVCRYKNKVYASSYAGKLYEINMLTLAVKEIPLPEPAAMEATVFVIMTVIDDKLYLSKAQGAFIVLDLKNNNYTPTLISNSDYFFRYIIYGDLANTDYRHQKLWVKVLNNKIFIKSNIYEIANKALKVFYTAERENNKLKTVSSYLQEGNDLYVGFLESGGLIKYTNYNNKSNLNAVQTLLPDVEVGDMLKDSRGNIWVSTLHDGVFLFLKNQKEIQRFSDHSKFYSDDIWYIKHEGGFFDVGYKQLVVDQFKKGNLYKRWVGDTTTNFNPVILFRNYKNKSIIFGSRNTCIINNEHYVEKKLAYKDIYVSDDDVYATVPGVLEKFSQKLDHFFITPDCTTSTDIKFNTIFALPDSVYIKGSTTGLYINDIPTKIQNRVTKVRSYNNDILACTDDGLYIKRGEKYFHISEKNGLPDNQCMQIEYYGDKYYKLLTKGGLAYIDTVNCKVAGVLSNRSLGNNTIIHHFDVENDSVWLATNKGIFTLSEKLVLSQINESVTAYIYPDKLAGRAMKYTQAVFEMKYSHEQLLKMIIEILDFSPKDYYIAYRIENDKKVVTDPVQVLERSFFVNIPKPGNYTIKLLIGSDKNHIEKTLTYLLKITPLWYQTIWAKLLFTVSIILALLITIKLTTRYIIRQNEKILKEKYAMLQLQSQAFFTQLNPHFIFNALTPLQSHILKNDKIASLEYLDHFSSLMRDILKNSDKMEINLKDEVDFIKKYIAIQQIRFSPPFLFEINIDPALDQENISLPAMMLQPIIENAIEHGVKNRGAGGHIIVDINVIIIQGKECLQIHISDNGPGITDNILKEGHALYILQKRVQTLQKKDGIIASLTYEPGKNSIGTTFNLVLSKTMTLWML